MGWYFRKSVGLGPFRMNFSKSGISYSFGAKGARINTGPRGTYVNFGANGIYYRKKVGGFSHEHQHQENQPDHPTYLEPQLHTITSGPIEQITDVDSQEFVRELNRKSNKISLLKWIALPICCGGLLWLYSHATTVIRREVKKSYMVFIPSGMTDVNVRSKPDPKADVLGKANRNDIFPLVDSVEGWKRIRLTNSDSAYGYIHAAYTRLDSTETVVKSITRLDEPTTSFATLPVAVIIFCIGFLVVCRKLDSKRMMMEITYQMDEKIQGVYGKFLDHFIQGAKSNRIWQIIHSQHTGDWKRHAGAETLLNRIMMKGISLDKKPAPFFQTNIQIPSITLVGTELYFFPERLIIRKNKGFAAVFYKNLNIESYVSRFVEEESLPRDAQVVGRTWKHPNKDGSPDRRFSNNTQVPVCQYSYYTFSSATGIYETICTSKLGAFDEFTRFIKAVGGLQSKMHLK